MDTICKTLYHHDASQRVLIVRYENNLFGFEEQKLIDPYEGNERFEGREEKIWVPVGIQSFPICNSVERAEREARGRIEWLRGAAS